MFYYIIAPDERIKREICIPVQYSPDLESVPTRKT